MVKEVKSKIKNSVMKQIHNQNVHMHSKFYYVLLNIVLIVSVAGVLLLGAIFLSIFARDVNVARQLDLPAFGAPGVQEFIWRFPWAVTLLTVMAGVSLYWLVKKFSFSYRHGLFSLIGAIVLSVIGLSIVMSSTGIHDRFTGRGPFKPLATYENLADESIYAGKIVSVEGVELQLETNNGNYTVVLTHDTRRPPERDLNVGDEIWVIGELQDGIIRAKGIKFGANKFPGKTKGMMNRHEINAEPGA